MFVFKSWLGKSLSLIVCICTLPASGQEASTCGSDCQARIKSWLLAAEQMERDGNYDGAAQQYAAIIAEEPLSTQSQHAAVLAGQALQQATKHSEAIDFYNQAI